MNLQLRSVIAQNLNDTFGFQDKSAFNLFPSGLKHNNKANGFHCNLTLTNSGCFALSFSYKFAWGPLCVSPPCHPAIPAQQPGGEKYNKTRCHTRKEGPGFVLYHGAWSWVKWKSAFAAAVLYVQAANKQSQFKRSLWRTLLSSVRDNFMFQCSSKTKNTKRNYNYIAECSCQFATLQIVGYNSVFWSFFAMML